MRRIMTLLFWVLVIKISAQEIEQEVKSFPLLMLNSPQCLGGDSAKTKTKWKD